MGQTALLPLRRKMPVIIEVNGTISKTFRQQLSNILKKQEIRELQKTAIIGHCAHTSGNTEHSRWEVTSHLP
jgi:hypothetical protein